MITCSDNSKGHFSLDGIMLSHSNRPTHRLIFFYKIHQEQAYRNTPSFGGYRMTTFSRREKFHHSFDGKANLPVTGNTSSLHGCSSIFCKAVILSRLTKSVLLRSSVGNRTS